MQLAKADAMAAAEAAAKVGAPIEFDPAMPLFVCVGGSNVTSTCTEVRGAKTRGRE